MGRNLPLKAPIPLGWQQELQGLFDLVFNSSCREKPEQDSGSLFSFCFLSALGIPHTPNPVLTPIPDPAAGLGAPGEDSWEIPPLCEQTLLSTTGFPTNAASKPPPQSCQQN